MRSQLESPAQVFSSKFYEMLKNTFFEENSERLLLKKQPNRYVNARKMYKRHADLDALSTSICGTMTEPIKTPNFEGSD